MAMVLSRRSALAGLSSATIALTGQAHAAYNMHAGIDKDLVGPATRWLVDNFGESMERRLAGEQGITVAVACAVACQETAYVWMNRHFKAGRSAQEMLNLLVLDNVQHRGAFPENGTTQFASDPRFRDLAPFLIERSDASRAARRLEKTGDLLYGYGLYQYDLQHILTDQQFWRGEFTPPGEKLPVRGLWGDAGECVGRFVKIFRRCLTASHGDLKDAFRCYNGSGPAAEKYADIVMRFYEAAKLELKVAA